MPDFTTGTVNENILDKTLRAALAYVRKEHVLMVVANDKPPVFVISLRHFEAVKDALEALDDQIMLTSIIEKYRANPTGDPVMDRLIADVDAGQSSAIGAEETDKSHSSMSGIKDE